MEEMPLLLLLLLLWPHCSSDERCEQLMVLAAAWAADPVLTYITASQNQ